MPRRTTAEHTQAKPRPPGADFADFCCELIGSLGDVWAKRMFLGWGLRMDDLTVAVIAWNRLYLKADAETQPYFVAAGCQVFDHVANGVTRRMHCYTAPEDALESRTAMRPWAVLARRAAVAARKPSKAEKQSGAVRVRVVAKPGKLTKR